MIAAATLLVVSPAALRLCSICRVIAAVTCFPSALLSIHVLTFRMVQVFPSGSSCTSLIASFVFVAVPAAEFWAATLKVPCWASFANHASYSFVLHPVLVVIDFLTCSHAVRVMKPLFAFAATACCSCSSVFGLLGVDGIVVALLPCLSLLSLRAFPGVHQLVRLVLVVLPLPF